MSYEYEAMDDVAPVVLDIETAPLPNVRDYLEPPDLTDIKAPSNYKDEAKIADYIGKAKTDRLEQFERDCTAQAALDFNLARVVVIGWSLGGDAQIECCPSEEHEAVSIELFWKLAKRRTIVGFRIREFDLPMLIQRSRYLGIDYPRMDLGRYARGSNVTDLYDLLTFQGMRQSNLMRQSAASFARRFGIPVDDTVSGKDVPILAAAGEWNAIAAHCASDVQLTLALARKLGVVKAEAVPA